MPQLLRKLKLSHGRVKVESTPRRLAVIVERVQAKQEDAEERVRGPPAKVRQTDSGVACNIMDYLGNPHCAYTLPQYIFQAALQAQMSSRDGSASVSQWQLEGQ